jgi:hypothetical protein
MIQIRKTLQIWAVDPEERAFNLCPEIRIKEHAFSDSQLPFAHLHK